MSWPPAGVPDGGGGTAAQPWLPGPGPRYLRCAECGYGVALTSARVPDCPMCGCFVWGADLRAAGRSYGPPTLLPSEDGHARGRQAV